MKEKNVMKETKKLKEKLTSHKEELKLKTIKHILIFVPCAY